MSKQAKQRAATGAENIDSDEVRTGPITVETVVNEMTLEQIEEMYRLKKERIIPELFLEVKKLLSDRGVTFRALVDHAVASGALSLMSEDTRTDRGAVGRPYFINPEARDDGTHDTYGGAGPSPDWFAKKTDEGYHPLEFRSDRPLLGHVWRNPEDPDNEAETWRGEGVMPKWIRERIVWPSGKPRVHRYVLTFAEEDK